MGRARRARGRSPRAGDHSMNAALGSAGIILGFVASLGAIATLGVGLWKRRPKLLVSARTYVWMVAIGADSRRRWRLGACHGPYLRLRTVLTLAPAFRLTWPRWAPPG